MNTLNINLTPEEINKILAGLGNLPYIQVHELILKIKMQAEEQLQLTASTEETNIEQKLSS